MSEPRFPLVPAHKGHYESYYLRAADPAGGRSAWIRHTVFKRPGGPATALTANARLITDGKLTCTDSEYAKDVTAVHVGERLYLRVIDFDAAMPRSSRAIARRPSL